MDYTKTSKSVITAVQKGMSKMNNKELENYYKEYATSKCTSIQNLVDYLEEKKRDNKGTPEVKSINDDLRILREYLKLYTSA